GAPPRSCPSRSRSAGGRRPGRCRARGRRAGARLVPCVARQRGTRGPSRRGSLGPPGSSLALLSEAYDGRRDGTETEPGWSLAVPGRYGERSPVQPELLAQRFLTLGVELPVLHAPAAGELGGIEHLAPARPRPRQQAVRVGLLDPHRACPAVGGLQANHDGLERAGRHAQARELFFARERELAPARLRVSQASLEGVGQVGERARLARGQHVSAQSAQPDEELDAHDPAVLRGQRPLSALVLEVAGDVERDSLRPDVELLVHVPAPLRAREAELQRREVVHTHEGRDHRLVVVDPGLEVAHEVELEHREHLAAVVRGPIHLDVLLRAHRLGDEDRHRLARAQLAVARTLPAIPVHLRLAVVPEALELTWCAGPRRHEGALHHGRTGQGEQRGDEVRARGDHGGRIARAGVWQFPVEWMDDGPISGKGCVAELRSGTIPGRVDARSAGAAKGRRSLMSGSPRHDCAALLAHADWVRGLARHLVADAHAADDLAQDALAAALVHPPPDDRPLRGWLAGVLRNLVRQEQREAGNRRAREEVSVRAEVEDSSAELLERLDSHRALVEAVARLDEPYRAAILM